jgi:hypothetical protein
MELKPQDLLVSLKVFTKGKAEWNQRELAESLEMSLSEVNCSLKRAVKAGLMMRSGSRRAIPKSLPHALEEFIAHGVKYSFPAERGPMARGIPSGTVGAQIENEFLNGKDSELPVWPSPHGKVRGVGIRPLYKSVPDLVVKPENRDLYSLLSLVDLIRQGTARERKVALDKLAQRMEPSLDV